MSLIISHNTSALNTHRNLSLSGNSMAKAIEKLSSGYKINVGADDPSGLIISEQLRSQISGLERAVRNSSEAYNLIGIAEGALNEMNTILKKMRALAIHAANSGVTSPEQVAADQAEMDSGIETLNRIANTTRYSDQYLLNGSKQLVYDVTTVVDEPTDHALLDTKLSRVDQIFKRDGVKMSIGFTGEKNRYQANTSTSAQRAYLEADAAYSLSDIKGAKVVGKQEFILTGTSGSRMFSFAAGAHVGTIVEAINNVRDSTGIGATLTFASDVRIDQTVNGTHNGSAPDYGPPPVAAEPITGYSDGTYVYQKGDIQIYGAGLNSPETAKIETVCITPDAASAFKVGYNCDGDGKIYAKVIDKSTNSIEYYKDRECTMLIGKGDDKFFAAANNSGIPSSPTQNLDGLFIKLNEHNVENQDVFEIGVVGQRLDNLKDMNVTGLAGWTDVDHSVIAGVNLGVNTSPTGDIYYRYKPLTFESDGKTVKTFKVEAFSHSSCEPKYLVASSGTCTNNMNAYDPGGRPILDDAGNPVLDEDGNPKLTEPQIAGQTVRLESVALGDGPFKGQQSGLTITLTMPKPGSVMDAVGKDTASIIQSDEYQALYARLQNEAAGQRSEIFSQNIVDGVKSGANYINFTDAGSFQTQTNDLAKMVYDALNASVTSTGGTKWEDVEKYFKTNYGDSFFSAMTSYKDLEEAGYEADAKKLINDTVNAYKDMVWKEGGVITNSLDVTQLNAAIAGEMGVLSGSTMSALADRMGNEIVDLFNTAYSGAAIAAGGTPTWADVNTEFVKLLATYKASPTSALSQLNSAGYKTHANALYDNIVGKITTAGSTSPASLATLVAATATPTTYLQSIGCHSSAGVQSGVYSGLAAMNQGGKARDLTLQIAGWANEAAIKANGSWQTMEAFIRGKINNSNFYKEISAAGFGPEAAALVNAALGDIRSQMWQDPQMVSGVVWTYSGAVPTPDLSVQNKLSLESVTYDNLLNAGDKLVQTQVDQLIDNAMIHYESLVKNGNTADWENEVRNIFQQSDLYTNSSVTERAEIDLIVNDLVAGIVTAQGAGYNNSILITDAMDELLRSANATARSMMPQGEQVGNVSFINLGMRVYSVEYGSAETIRIQNKAGNLFYQYRESDSMEKVVIKAGTTVQVAGQDAEISLNGAPIYTTGMIANTTTPDFSGSLVFNKGKLGLTTLAIAGYDEGKLFSKATALQGVEENEPDITERNRHFEPPAVTVPMGQAKNDTAIPPIKAAGMLDKNGQPINLYIDFSQLDPTVQVKIQNLADPSAIKIEYDGMNINIDATALGGPDLATDDLKVSIPVNAGSIYEGFYVENPALKGLFVRTDALMDPNQSAGAFEVETPPEIQAEVGNVMLEVFTYATNPRSNTNEDLTNFLGGMQFQLGNTEGDQDRTVYSIQSMSMSELGRITYNGQEYCLQNVLGGGVASLSKDPILAMHILAKAVDDVSTLRARLGAFQQNMLQTNMNNLEVAIENLTKTESAIRDTDMAAESTQFTRFQIMQQAGTSMLAQANQVSQNVLSLLQ